MLALALLLPGASMAQTVRPGDERPELPSFEPPRRAPGTILPPLALPEQPDLPGSSAGRRVLVEGYRVTGNTVLPEESIRQLTEPLTGSAVSFAELQALRDRLTRAYIERGYVTSGAVIERIEDGVVEIQMVEGVLAGIDVSTDGRFRESTLRRRLRESREGPVNVLELEEQLQILQQDRRIRQVEAQLLPAERRGESLLKMRVSEEAPFFAVMRASNDEPPGIGAVGARTELGFTNVTGFGDSFSAAYHVTEGLDEVDASYEIPLPYDMALGLRVRRTWSEAVEDPFDDLDIEARTATYGVTLKYLAHRSLRSSFGLFLTGEHRRSKTELLGEGFAFTEGPDEDGVAKIAVLRFGQEWIYRARRDAVAVRSMLSLGTSALDATSNRGDVPDGQYLAWLAQLQWAHRFDFLDARLLVRGDLQLTDSPLLGLEQFAIGGHSSVRGYRENTLVRDNGAVGSVEARIPVWSAGEWGIAVEVAPFFDIGYSWNEDRSSSGPQTLASVGVGLRAAIRNRIFLEGYWGEPLRDVDVRTEHDLQDSGFHLGLTVRFP